MCRTCARRSTPGDPKLIHTLRGVGYVLRAPADEPRPTLGAAGGRDARPGRAGDHADRACSRSGCCAATWSTASTSSSPPRARRCGTSSPERVRPAAAPARPVPRAAPGRERRAGPPGGRLDRRRAAPPGRPEPRRREESGRASLHRRIRRREGARMAGRGRAHPDGRSRVVAVSMGDIDHTVARLTAIVAGVGAAVLLALGLACYWLGTPQSAPPRSHRAHRRRHRRGRPLPAGARTAPQHRDGPPRRRDQRHAAPDRAGLPAIRN